MVCYIRYMYMDRGELLRQCRTISSNYISGSSITWDDAVGTLYFLLTIVVVILASISGNKDRDVQTARNSLRVAAGVIVVLLGVYNFVLYYYGIPYSMPSRIMIGSKQVIIGIVFIVTASIFLSKK